MTSTDNDPIRALWDRQSVWSQAGDAVKRRIQRSRIRALALATAGAVLGTASVEVAGLSSWLGRACAAFAAVAIALVPVFGETATSSAVRDWTRVRAVSESLKAEVYTFLAGVAPYRGEDRISLLLDATGEIAADSGDLTRYTVGIKPRVRDLPAVRDVPTYLEKRLTDQVDGYYRRKAAIIHTKVRRLGNVQLWLAVVGAALAAVTGFFPGVRLGMWVGVVTTIGAAVATHVAAERYGYQEVEFTRTADQLEVLRLRFLVSPQDAAAGDALVTASERVISIQNDGWMVRQTSSDPDENSPARAPRHR